MVRTRFTWRQSAERLVSLYSDLVGKAAPVA
jgi:hypothetical protein